MKNIIKFFVATFFIFQVATVNAQSVTFQQAQKVALNFMKQEFKSDFKITNSRVEIEGKDTLLYVFQINGSGFVIMPNDKRIMPILGYSEKSGGQNINDINPQTRYWLEGYKEQIKAIKKGSVKSNEEKDALNTWLFLLGGLQGFQPQNYEIINLSCGLQRFLNTPIFNQNNPYNTLCPLNTPTGCVATAMTEVMFYHRHPRSGVGAKSYTDVSGASTGSYSANFGNTVYDWNTSNTNSIALLMFHAGVSVGMNYETGGSGALTSESAVAMGQYFKYQNGGLEYRTSQPDAQWQSKLTTSICAGRPMIYRGQSSSTGHAWVCDGYAMNFLNRLYFNMNWGWGGYLNGLFRVSNIYVDTNNFNNVQAVVINKPI